MGAVHVKVAAVSPGVEVTALGGQGDPGVPDVMKAGLDPPGPTDCTRIW